MALVPSFGPVLGLAVLLGLVAGGSLTLCYTIGGLMVPEDVRTTAFGFFSGAALFGGAVSPSVAGLVAHLGLRRIYCVDAALYLALAAVRARPSRGHAARWSLAHEDLPPLRPRDRDLHPQGRADRGMPLLPLGPEVLPQLPAARPRGQQPVPRAPGRVAVGEGQGGLLRVFEFREISLSRSPGMGGAQSGVTRGAGAAFDALFGKKK